MEEHKSADNPAQSFPTNFNDEKTEEVKKKDGQDEVEKSNKKVVYFLFFVILLMNLLINFDHGVMPAGAVAMKADL